MKPKELPEIKSCPICGKIPKIQYPTMMSPDFTLECSKWDYYNKRHDHVVYVTRLSERAVIKAWNRRNGK